LGYALELFDLSEGLVECGVAGAFAVVGGADDLLLRGQRGLEALLLVVGGEPRVKCEGGDEDRGQQGGNFNCAAGHLFSPSVLS
jgi:hypothetical protein